jgi:hypothetical protein
MKTRHFVVGLSAVLVLALAIPALGSPASTHTRTATAWSAGTGAAPQEAEVSYWGDMSASEKAEANRYATHCTFRGPDGERIEAQMLPSLVAGDEVEPEESPSIEVHTTCDW